MTVGGVQQVMLQVRVAEVQRDAVRKLNAQMNTISNNGKWVAGGVNGGATFPDAMFQPGDVRIPIFGNGTNAGGNPIGPVFDEFMPNMPSISNTGLFASFLSNDFLANVVLDAFQNARPGEDPRRADADHVDRAGSAVPVGRQLPDPGVAGARHGSASSSRISA